MTTPIYPADEIVHLDAIGQRIMPGDVVWASSNSSGTGPRLVVKLTEHKVLVDRASPKDGCTLLVVTNLLKGLPDTKIYDGLISSFGNKINNDVKSKASTAPLRFVVVSHYSSTVSRTQNITQQPTHVSIHEVRGTTNADTDIALEAARELGRQSFGDHVTFGSCIWKKPQKHHVRYDRVTGKYITEDRDWNWTTAAAESILLTMKRIQEIGILHLPTNQMITLDEFNNSVSDARYKYPTT